MSESLNEQIALKFAGLSDHELAKRIEKAPDFGYDDETVELNRRLALGGMAWRWAQGDQHVEIYVPAVEAAQQLSEPDLITLMTTLETSSTPLAAAARDEYFKRRGEVIDAAIEARRLEDLQ
ncbi:hypothetical protein [Naasia lichenicola]|uniref:hypothetical protein n=1 Tax=Naasia lichenicola TaxID=2565933 RepID=UPI0018EE7E00|nr:hypothetical protein [Naasia lichenicola]